MSQAAIQLFATLSVVPPPPSMIDKAEPGPPALPASTDALLPAVYIEAAHLYIDSYPFTRPFYRLEPKTRKRKLYYPDKDFADKHRLYLNKCVDVDRRGVAALWDGPGPYDPTSSQLDFVRKHIFPRRWQLEELASELVALCEFVRSETRPASAVVTPTDTGKPGKQSTKDKVKLRDVGCRLTGLRRRPANLTPEQAAQLVETGPAIATKLQVVHGIPFQVAHSALTIFYALTGITIRKQDWEPDTPQNAFVATPAIHDLFRSFKLYLKFTSDDIIIRGRVGAGDPLLELTGFMNDRKEPCSSPGALLNQPLRRTYDDTIPDINEKYFSIHRFVGDIVWLCDGAESESDEEEDDYKGERVLSETTVEAFLAKLESPQMGMVPRMQETILNTRRLELVNKNSVWTM